MDFGVYAKIFFVENFRKESKVHCKGAHPYVALSQQGLIKLS